MQTIQTCGHETKTKASLTLCTAGQLLVVVGEEHVARTKRNGLSVAHADI